jgi:hypothetical protein
MARKICEWESKSGQKGFVQEEIGWFGKKLVVYKKGGLFGLGSEKLGEISPSKLEDVFKQLEEIVGEKVKVWKV